MPNFFNYFALVLFFIVVSPTAISPSTYLYIHISVYLVLVSVPTLYINSMIKQKSKTFIIFFYYFFHWSVPTSQQYIFILRKTKKQRKKFFSRCSLLYTLYYTITSLHFTQLLLFIPIYIYIVARVRKTKTLYSYLTSFSFFIIYLLLLLFYLLLYYTLFLYFRIPTKNLTKTKSFIFTSSIPSGYNSSTISSICSISS